MATNEFKDCDGVVILNLFHKPKFAYKEMYYRECGRTEQVGQQLLRKIEIGDLLEGIIQGNGRGVMRKGKKQHTLLFTPNTTGLIENISDEGFENYTIALLEGLSKSYPQATIGFYDYADPLAFYSGYKTEEEKRNSRARKWTPEEKKLVKSFKKTCRRKEIECSDTMVRSYLNDRSNNKTMTPVKWLKASQL